MGIFQKTPFGFKIQFSRNYRLVMYALDITLLHSDICGSFKDPCQNGLFYRQQIAYNTFASQANHMMSMRGVSLN